MAFHDVEFPKELFSIAGGPTWSTDVIRLGGGAEQRIAHFGDALRRYDAGLNAMPISDYRAIQKHLNGRRGRLHSFPLKDKLLFQATTEPLGTGGGIGSTTQLIINEGDASNAYNREIYLPVAGFQVRADGVLKTITTDYTVGTGANSGLLTWVTSVSGQSLTWTGEFRVPVRYDVDGLPDFDLIALTTTTTGVVLGSTSIPLVEVRYIGEW